MPTNLTSGQNVPQDVGELCNREGVFALLFVPRLCAGSAATASSQRTIPIPSLHSKSIPGIFALSQSSLVPANTRRVYMGSNSVLKYISETHTT